MQLGSLVVTNTALWFTSVTLCLLHALIFPTFYTLSTSPLLAPLCFYYSSLVPSVIGWLGCKGSHVTALRVSESQSSTTEIIAM